MRRVQKHFDEQDPIMGKLMRGHKLKPRKRNVTDPFEYLALTILYQQLSTKVADVIARRFRGLFDTGAFPSPKEIMSTPDEQLRGVGISWAKVKYIKDLAAKIHTKEVSLSGLGVLPDEEVIAELTKVKGIGRWTAEMFLMSALGRPDIFSFGDLGLQTAIKRAYGMRVLPSRRTMERLSKRWSPYRTHAARVLWASLDNE